jgi:hypothetical protein
MKRTLIVGYVLALALFLFGQRHPDGSSPAEFHAVVDLTHSIDTQTLAFARARKSSSLTDVFGTRIDAPAHFAHSLWTVDQIPTERPDRAPGRAGCERECRKAPGLPDFG